MLDEQCFRFQFFFCSKIIRTKEHSVESNGNRFSKREVKDIQNLEWTFFTELIFSRLVQESSWTAWVFFLFLFFSTHLISRCCYSDFSNLLNAWTAFSIPKPRSQNTLRLHLSCRLHFSRPRFCFPSSSRRLFLVCTSRPHRFATYYFYYFSS